MNTARKKNVALMLFLFLLYCSREIKREQRWDGGRGIKKELVLGIAQVSGEVRRPYAQQSTKRRVEVR